VDGKAYLHYLEKFWSNIISRLFYTRPFPKKSKAEVALNVKGLGLEFYSQLESSKMKGNTSK
jgi:hypothetical protein